MHLPLLNVVISRDEIHESGFSASALSHESDCLALGDGEIDVAQNPFLVVAEGDVAEFYLMLERGDMPW